MQDEGLGERFDFGSELIAEASALAMRHFERFEALAVTHKGRQDVASEADLATERLIRERLADRFPEDGFMGEETGRSEVAGRRGIWVVDPIDGSQTFLLGMSDWCVSIAYLHEGVPEMGFVSAPALAESFVGRRGVGATLNGRAIHVSDAARIEDGIVYVGYSTRIEVDDVVPVIDRLLRRGGMYYRGGSGTLGLCYVACGRFIGYVEPHLNAWDALAAIAIVEAAGGRANDFLADGGLWRGSRIIAGPPAVYPALEAVLTGSADG
jgi:myo-inositol-1(or 4)-monophosphatase